MPAKIGNPVRPEQDDQAATAVSTWYVVRRRRASARRSAGLKAGRYVDVKNALIFSQRDARHDTPNGIRRSDQCDLRATENGLTVALSSPSDHQAQEGR